jgi:hypothetical protein
MTTMEDDVTSHVAKMKMGQNLSEEESAKIFNGWKASLHKLNGFQLLLPYVKHTVGEEHALYKELSKVNLLLSQVRGYMEAHISAIHNKYQTELNGFQNANYGQIFNNMYANNNANNNNANNNNANNNNNNVNNNDANNNNKFLAQPRPKNLNACGCTKGMVQCSRGPCNCISNQTNCTEGCKCSGFNCVNPYKK